MLLFAACYQWEREPHGAEGQALVWVSPDEVRTHTERHTQMHMHCMLWAARELGPLGMCADTSALTSQCCMPCAVHVYACVYVCVCVCAVGVLPPDTRRHSTGRTSETTCADTQLRSYQVIGCHELCIMEACFLTARLHSSYL